MDRAAGGRPVRAALVLAGRRDAQRIVDQPQRGEVGLEVREDPIAEAFGPANRDDGCSTIVLRAHAAAQLTDQPELLDSARIFERRSVLVVAIDIGRRFGGSHEQCAIDHCSTPVLDGRPVRSPGHDQPFSGLNGEKLLERGEVARSQVVSNASGGVHIRAAACYAAGN